MAALHEGPQRRQHATRSHGVPAPSSVPALGAALALCAGLLLSAVLTLAPATASGASSGRGPVVVKAASRGSLGVILVSANGFTLYRYTPDKNGHPTCTGACAAVWPPVLLPRGSRTPRGGHGVGGLKAVKVADGRWQVTYHGMPLYRYAGDRDAGSTAGQGIGGVWFVVPTSSRSAGGPGAASATHTTSSSSSSGGSSGSGGWSG